VIAIIGILSGLIVVTMSGVTDKANIAKAQVFSNSLRNALMLNLVAEWKFDQVNYPASNQTPDNWGSYTGTLQGAGGTNNRPQLSADCVYSNCLNFDGTDDRVSVTNNTNLNMTSKITIEAWIKPTRLDVNYQGIVTKAPGHYGYHFMTYSSGSINKICPHARIGGVWEDTCESPTLSLNKWNFVAWTYNSTSGSKCYVNTDYTTNGDSGAISYESDDNLYIGYSRYGSQWFNGYIDNVRLYSETIPTSEIRSHYYAGLNNLLAKGEITAGEYKEMILSSK
jgi:type II secretory pathway pseudopilin PulG